MNDMVDVFKGIPKLVYPSSESNGCAMPVSGFIQMEYLNDFLPYDRAPFNLSCLARCISVIKIFKVLHLP